MSQFLHPSSRLLLAFVASASVWREILGIFVLLTRILLVVLSLGGILFLISRLLKLIRGDLSGNFLDASDFVTGIAPPGPLPAPPKSKDVMIGRYKVASTLGAGGMGTVFKAVDEKDQPVAIKVIGGGQLQGTALARAKKHEGLRIGLVREARLAAELRHPNIVQIYDIGQNKGTLYVVMELLDGMPLDRYARSHPISAPEALRIVAELCDALECAHSHSIIHRDIKPPNIFIAANGIVKVLDFGLALAQDGTVGQVAGTWAYMSPEQILGGELDARTDIWSAGITLFQLLTSRPAFTGRTLTELRGNILDAPTPKLPFVGPFAHELNSLIVKALSKDREQRYPSACEFAADLRQIMQQLQKGRAAGLQLSSSSTQSPQLVDNSRRSLSTYKPIQLGFREQLKSPVLLFPVPQRKGLDLPEVPPGLVAGLAALAAFYGYISVFFWASIFLLAAVGSGLALLLYRLRPSAFAGCRTCRRRMVCVSSWSRPTWRFQERGFCVPDCIAALKAGFWEEAVKLLWVHTSEEKTDRQYRLEFFECYQCRDQRAYLLLAIKGVDMHGIREAYRFGSPEKIRESVARNPAARQSAPDQGATDLAASGTLQNRGDIHNQRTV
jgi:serine/threonine protein kinase